MSPITINTSISIPNGPNLGFSRTVPIGAYKRIDAIIPVGLPAASTTTVQLFPSAMTGVKFIAILSDWYSASLTYTVGTDTIAYKLDQPLLLLGEGASSLFAATVDSLKFSNLSGAGAQTANLQILIGY